MVMAVRAFQFAFPDGMVRSPILLRPDGPVADVTEVRLRSLQIFPGSRVNGMAVVTGNIGNLMLGQVPEGEVSGFSMAGKAFG
jgi:hypothetical protein